MIIGEWLKKNKPSIKVVFGGGYCNTELTYLSEPRFFSYTDFVVLNDGEERILSLFKHINNQIKSTELHDTYYLQDGKIIFHNKPDNYMPDINLYGAPDYRGIDFNKYFTMIESTNPAHRLWSQRGFVKLRMALGCYHGKCIFCDNSIDYVRVFKSFSAEDVVKQIEKIINDTGLHGFHFTDEAIPPSIAYKFAQIIIEKKINITWWGNIRFDKAFTPTIIKTLSKSGLIAVSGGLETCNNRLLNLIKKGFSIEDAISVTRSFKENGVLVHCYMIYGLPTETVEEFYNSLEVLRQMFREECIDSAYYHRFALTRHSEAYIQRNQLGLRPESDELTGFANNDIEYTDNHSKKFDQLASSIKTAIYNFNHKNLLNEDISVFFKNKIKKIVSNNFVKTVINKQIHLTPDSYMILKGLEAPSFIELNNTCYIGFETNNNFIEYEVSNELYRWLKKIFKVISQSSKTKLIELGVDFPVETDINSGEVNNFETFIKSELFDDMIKSNILTIEVT